MSDVRAGRSLGLPFAEKLPNRVGIVILAVALTIAAWPIAYTPAATGLDPSWQVALHLAALSGLRQGVDFVFTYGPLGFLGLPHPYVGATSTLALVASFVVYLSLLGTMLIQARRALPLWAAAITTLVMARVLLPNWPFEAFELLIFLVCVEAIADRIPLRATWLVVAAGILAGVALLGKQSVGAFVLAMLAVTAMTISRRGWRGLLLFAVTTAASFLAGWILAGQQIGDIGTFAGSAFQIITGYQEAMHVASMASRDWLVLACVVVGVVLTTLSVISSRSWPLRRRLGLAGLTVVILFSLWKMVVVRDQSTAAFGIATLAAFAFAGPPVGRRTWLFAIAALGLAFAGASTIQPGAYLDVPQSIRSIAREASSGLRPDRVERAAQRNREVLRSKYRIDPDILSAITGKTVHIDPYETAVAFAYPEVTWSPLPVIQSFSAYTPALDALNAARLRSPDAPEAILRRFQPAGMTEDRRQLLGRPLREGEVVPSAVDGRFAWFESPSATLETFCRYRQLAVSAAWQVLSRTRDTCGPPESIKTVTARTGDAVDVPTETRPDRFVVVRVRGLEASPLERLRMTLATGTAWYVTVDDTRYRLVPGTAADGLLLAVPPAGDGSEPFAFGAPKRTIAINDVFDGPSSGKMLTYEFLSVPMNAP